ncbi:hypothetical protein R1flu_023331 [Riccia fluitans]|uniref:Uncharacterized protein n=1 Tax=Riccia fluitans TaxID=41844 RepID=A0ABD1XS87_9MARC
MLSRERITCNFLKLDDVADQNRVLGMESRQLTLPPCSRASTSRSTGRAGNRPLVAVSMSESQSDDFFLKERMTSRWCRDSFRGRSIIRSPADSGGSNLRLALALATRLGLVVSRSHD